MIDKETASLKEPSVLCVIDFSSTSEDALRAAIPAAERNHARLMIIHPYRLNHAGSMEDQVKMKRAIEEESRQNFRKLSHVLNDVTIPFDFRPEIGFLTDRVQEHLKKANIILLIMSRELAKASRESLMELLPQIDIPILIIPKTKIGVRL